MTTLIAGIFRLDGKDAERETVSAMLDAMQPSDLPASRTLVRDGPFSAGVLHLSPKGSAAPEAPEVLRKGRTILVADANLVEPIGNALIGLNNAFGNNEAIDGQLLHGDFAFARWNGTHLWLARDQIGVRPLQYTVRAQEYVAFASLPGALLQCGLAERILDAQTLQTYPIAGMAIAPRTYFSGIRSVPAAHCVTFDRGGDERSERYWRLPLGPLFRADERPEVLASELLHLMEQAVRRRLPANGLCAGHLSGGLDSGSITALAARMMGDQGRTFHAFCFAENRDDPDLKIVDETPYAQAIAEHAPNIRLHTIDTPDQVALMQKLDADLFLSTHSDEPEEQVLRFSAQHGATTVLSGWGGDEVVTWRGHSNFAELFWDGQWRSLARAIHANANDVGGSRWAIFRKAVLSESLPSKVRDLIRSRHQTGQPEWVNAVRGMVPPQSRNAIDSIPGRETGRDSRRDRRSMLEHWSLQGRLEVFAQRGARHGIRYAYPMLDLDLLAFAVRIPSVLLKADGLNRAIFRQAMRGVLPDKVRLKNRKLTPYPAETLRQSLQKDHMTGELEQMRANPLIQRFIDIGRLQQYITKIREPQEIRSWMNEFADRDEQVVQHELYHIFAVWLAWYLNMHGTEAR